MSDIVINGITYPAPKRVAFPGSDGQPVVFDLPEDADKGLNAYSERPVQNKVIHAAVQEIHRHLTSPYNFKGALASSSALPAASADNVNDTYYLISEKYRVTSNGERWEQSSMNEGDYEDALVDIRQSLAACSHYGGASIDSQSYSYKLANVTEQIIFVARLNDGWTDAPANNDGIFESKRYTTWYQLQTYLVFADGKTARYDRIVDRSNGNVYRDWVLEFDSADREQFRASVQKYTSSVDASGYSGLLANITDNVIFLATTADWSDLPEQAQGIFENRRYSGSYQIQHYTIFYGKMRRYSRIVSRSDGAVFRGWSLDFREDQENFKILAVGDSICRGGRNSGKGFVGDLGYPYINMGVGGASLSSSHSAYTDSIHKFPDATNIPNQITAYYNRTSEEISAAFGTAKFTPDVIVANGGINDYFYGLALGELSDAPATTAEEAAALDRSTLLGGLEYAFYQMVTCYPQAQRLFVITHKTQANGTYCPATVNRGGYTQQQMHDAILRCCQMYGVVVADVYQGMMDTKFPQYRTTADRYQDAAATDYCDKDGIHPLFYGYTQAYAPLVRAALRACATAK